MQASGPTWTTWARTIKCEVIAMYCTQLHANWHCLAGQCGDHLPIHGMVTPPGLYNQAGTMNNLIRPFMLVDAPALTTAEILVAAAADPTAANPTANWMDLDVGANVSRWLMLPVHMKIAILFLQGCNLMAGFHLRIEIPVEFSEEQVLWEGQLRVGVTHTYCSGCRHIHAHTTAPC
jgi:hypothetical protein